MKIDNDDSISRSALKSEFDKHCVGQCNECPYCREGGDCTLIDNAPTVETDIEVIAKDAYEHGYTDGWKERFGEPNERPQGKWSITDETDEFYGRVYRCTHCGEEMLACGCRNFCPNCGADMRGDKE